MLCGRPFKTTNLEPITRLAVGSPALRDRHDLIIVAVPNQYRNVYLLSTFGVRKFMMTAMAC